jgi:hypothetical protein
MNAFPITRAAARRALRIETRTADRLVPGATGAGDGTRRLLRAPSAIQCGAMS